MHQLFVSVQPGHDQLGGIGAVPMHAPVVSSAPEAAP
jgi:hypothetical protein